MPLVSIIVPCYNEQGTICLLLDAIILQTVEARDLEVIIADGQSTDGTREQIESFQQMHPDLEVRVVENRKRVIPAGLNCALAEARGKYVLRLDGHSVPQPDYIQRCIEDLEAGHGDNVGGVWEIKPRGKGLVQRAIALAAAHPLAVGDARYRYATSTGYVDTVPFGAFKQDVFKRVGNFDETLLTNEDYEFNARLRRAGGRVWLNPKIRSTYFARPSLGSLASQYWRYGFWKWRMLKRYPQTLRLRQALPPLFVLSLPILLLVGILIGPARWPALELLLIELGVYLFILLCGSLRPAWTEKDWRLIFLLPWVIVTMHMSWGAGFWWSVINNHVQVKVEDL